MTEDPTLSLVERARRAIPGGINSNNRALPWPFVPVEATGAYIRAANGLEYLDYHAAYGPIVLGYRNPAVNAAVKAALDKIDLVGAGVSVGEIELAEALQRLIPSAERVVLCNSGSEATYSALRLARAVTGRTRIIKFQGAYHGWHDAVLLNVISPADRIGHPDPLSLGMVPQVVANTIVLPFNDASALEREIAREGHDLAAVIVEVIPHNIGCVLPKPGFLEAVRKHTSAQGILLIFDEVVTGFRHALGGYQAIAGVTPDISVFAKAMANGFPIAAVVGRAEYMDRFAPGGKVFHAGTFNGHPVSVAAANATIAELKDGTVHARAAHLAAQLAAGLEAIAKESGVAMTVAKFGSVVVPYFMEGPIDSYTDLLRNDDATDIWFRRSMCEKCIFMLPTALKRNHISAAHTQADIDRTLDAARGILRRIPSAKSRT